ncbi:alpha-L-fucosidase [Luteolibacter sp. AS25]|uniref:alpha-L-fucosidase n=1 Tax=Luteolibacter sp. AS25 TaxID=3135776 RepID=UPI00398BA58D
MKPTRYSFLPLMACLLLAKPCISSAESEPDRLEWFRDAKFGMFIHFGASERGREKIGDLTPAERFEASVHDFNPVDFDADEWLRVAKDGGAKYIVFTAKHHDGFCKWDSALTEWDVMDQTEFKRDIVGELAEACEKTDVRLGLYYSIGDWYHPEFDPYFSNRNGFHYRPNPDAEITEYMKFMYAQIEELCVKYQPSLFWFDGSSGFRPPERKRLLGQQDLVNLLHSHGAISNSRLGDDDSLRYVDYLSMGDNQVPPGNIGLPFETAGTMNESWHYSEGDDHYQSVGKLLERLVMVVGRGGNYLLNVGPNAKGVIPEPAVERLEAMGDWLETHGEAIYGTEAGPHPHGMNWGTITQRRVGKNSRLYMNVVDWPEGGKFEFYGLDNKILDASLLDGGQTLDHTSEFDAAAGVNRLTIQVPETAPNEHVSVIALTVEGTASMEQARMQQSDGSIVLDAYTATMHDSEFVADKPRRAVDFKMFTVPLRGEGIMPGRMLSVDHFGEEGQALSWDFRVLEPGDYELSVVTIGEGHKDGRVRARVSGQEVENALLGGEEKRSIELPPHLKETFSVLGTVKISNPGMQTLTMEVAAEFPGFAPRIRGVRLTPLAE